MKNKWLIFLFILFLVAILLSLLIGQQSQKVVSLHEKEISKTDQPKSRVLPAYASPVSQVPSVSLPLTRKGITIIQSTSSSSPEENIISVPKIADKASNNISSQNVASSTQTEDSLQAGVTIMRKQPSPKEAQEMNSSGIVMY